jgi:hypothetical protein
MKELQETLALLSDCTSKQLKDERHQERQRFVQQEHIRVHRHAMQQCLEDVR